MARKNGAGREITDILSDIQKLIYSTKHLDYSENNYNKLEEISFMR